MSLLSEYAAATRDFLNDPNKLYWSDAQITGYVNRGRTRVANDSQCIRILPPSTGSIATAVQGVGGSGYTSAPTVTINAPDGPVGGVQAVITANAPVGGAITGYTIVNAGSGYCAPPVVTLSGGGGTGATCIVTLTPLIRTIGGQETYAFSSFTPAIQFVDRAVAYVVGVQSISVAWGSLKPTLNKTSWTDFQANYRSYNYGNQNYPSLWAEYGRGQGASAYLWTIPASSNAMDVDCYCAPIALVDDTTPDAVPEPFSAAVPYYAAALAYANAQRRDDSEFYRQKYIERMIECGVYATPSYAPSAYVWE